MPSEPPDADPHVRWCGGRRGEPGAYPIRSEAEWDLAGSAADVAAPVLTITSARLLIVSRHQQSAGERLVTASAAKRSPRTIAQLPTRAGMCWCRSRVGPKRDGLFGRHRTIAAWPGSDWRHPSRLSHKPLQNLVHQLVGGITLVAYPRSHVRLGQWLQIAAFSAPSSHHHWSSDFLGALRDSLHRKPAPCRR